MTTIRIVAYTVGAMFFSLATVAARGADKAASSTTPVVDGGTFIHVKNGTGRTLTFSLFVETKSGTGKFDEKLKIQPGQTAIWRLKPGHEIAKTQVQGKTFYRVGLVGVDSEKGTNHRWGVIGGKGMLGRELRTTDTADGTDSVRSFLNIQINPIGSF